MERESIPPKTLLFTVIVLAIVSAQAFVYRAAASMSPQGGGGRVQPTPTPKKTTPPKKSTTPAKTNRTNASKTPARKTEPEAAKTGAAEIAFWDTIKTSTNPEDFREYLKKYPNGEFAGLARNRLNVLETAVKEEAARKEEAKKEESKRTEAEAAKKRPGALVTNSIGMELVYIPAGSFMMGSETGHPREKPVHQVTIREGFYMGRYEVTQGQWQTVMGSNPSKYKGFKLPVDTVSWADAQEFIRLLNEREDGYAYRLPTEAEWEYACRAGTTTAFAFGDTLSSKQANLNPATEGPTGVQRFKPIPVGSFQPNAWGLYDMHGNVSEWCEDVYHDNYDGAPTDGSAWLSGGHQIYRIQRGGSWGHPAYEMYSAYRGYAATRGENEGFRVVAMPKTK